MDGEVSDSLIKDYKGHWTDFRKAFMDAFTDLAEGVTVEKDLRDLCMKEGDIDTYIATFKKLAQLAGYDKNEHGLVNMFKRGLPNSLAIRVIQNSSTIPVTLEGWIMEAHQQQLRYLQTHEFSKKGLSPQELALTKKLSIHTNNHQCNPDAMDVDSGNITQFTQLTDTKRETLKAKGACFRCCKQGHMSRQCPLKQGGNGEYGRPAPNQVCAGTMETTEETKKDVDTLLNKVRECLKQGDNKQKFFDGLIESDFA